MRHVLERHVAAVRLAVHLEVAQRAQHHVELLDDVRRQPDGARLIHDRALDRLADPPRRVRREAEAALGIEFVERVDEAQVAFLDQVGKREPAVGVMLRDADDEPQVVLDQPLPRGEIAAGHRPRERELLRRGQEHVLADLVEIDLRDVVDDVRAQAGGGLGKRQLLRPAVGFRPRCRFVVGCGRLRVRHLPRARDPGSSRRRGAPHAGGRSLGAHASWQHARVRRVERSRCPADCGMTCSSPAMLTQAADSEADRPACPCRRISKCSLTWSASVLPISAIFWPRVTCWPSFTRISLLCA